MMVSFFKAVPSNRRPQEAQPISSLDVYTLCVYRPQNPAIYDGRETYDDQNKMSDPLLTPMTRSPLPRRDTQPPDTILPCKTRKTRFAFHKTRFAFTQDAIYVCIHTYRYIHIQSPRSQQPSPPWCVCVCANRPPRRSLSGKNGEFSIETMSGCSVACSVSQIQYGSVAGSATPWRLPNDDQGVHMVPAKTCVSGGNALSSSSSSTS